jgi:carbon-monoxide dehydrogenase large subunit
LLSGSMMDYTMPRADDLPNITVGTEVTLCTHNPLGVKGCGEVGAIGSPPAIINAIIDAMKEYGVRHIDMPATPGKIWSIIQGAAPRMAAE